MSQYTYLAKEIFVGTNSTMGWVTPVERKAKDDSWTAAFEKKMERIKSWIGTDGKHNFYVNKPTSGFKIVGFNSRYSTSNKFMLLKDPRGFKTEMSISDFTELIREITIENGIIKNPLMYQSDKLLITEKRKAQIEAQNKKLREKVSVQSIVKPSQLKLGSTITAQISLNEELDVTFLGKHYVTKVTQSYDGTRLKLKNLKSKTYLIHVPGKGYHSGFITSSQLKIRKILSEPKIEHTVESINKMLQKDFQKQSQIYDAVFAISENRVPLTCGFDFTDFKSGKNARKYFIRKTDGILAGLAKRENGTISEYYSLTEFDDKTNELSLERQPKSCNLHGYSSNSFPPNLGDIPTTDVEFLPIQFYVQIGDNKYEV